MCLWRGGGGCCSRQWWEDRRKDSGDAEEKRKHYNPHGVRANAAFFLHSFIVNVAPKTGTRLDLDLGLEE